MVYFGVLGNFYGVTFLFSPLKFQVVEQTTDAEKVMAVFEFLDFKRKNKVCTVYCCFKIVAFRSVYSTQTFFKHLISRAGL